ncbi:hypothetical protein BDU57DRAFT_542569 [Ampelomyces quisqualis]|uniref:RRM domain-containing protein n=1 Tax=Ampelomyces quisqualis TaxID=50730 RepID=A0A6A5QCH1_AMPQU|nr:hypothetical protein BDU57DRAFT_542569 [Ampelomyces quisqualis]
MPRAQSTKAKDEHLIFVKNVPADLAIAAIPHLYAQFEPTRIKNVYPNGDITTVVVGFETHEEATQAQQETDGIRLENVVLRVEMYSKHRSVRFLRETRTSHRPHGAVDEDYEELVEEMEQSEYVLPFGHSQGHAPGTTWARIVGNKKNGTGMTPLPAAAVPATPQPTLNDENQTPESTPILEVAFPCFNTVTNTKVADPDLASTGNVQPRSPRTSSTEIAGYEGDVEDNQKARKRQPTRGKVDMAVRTSIFAPWHLVNTSRNISQRHRRDCLFCKMHEADWKRN